ncbi:S41 family peptidase [Mariniflexile sp. AS56]|uniref:S41 family peptidase n=1 Tax=Mariniflexile sp. AS56 TaxID=3063957 RepID=UPI0026EB1283|nr:S41 family peptidase [Mariniflexile sp. AS56]MDO7170623.1 S41 family peptidase [Mariniflexile sp. AS56]
MKTEKLLLNLLFIFIISSVSLVSCSKNDEAVTDVVAELNNEINDFVWQGLNNIYLWKENIPNLADNKFTTQDEYYTFLNRYNTPENLFDDLLYQKGVVDKFSLLIEDYVVWENALQGTSKTDGLNFNLARLGNSNDIFGYVEYIANGSDASTKDINRGDFFLTADGQQLTVDNYIGLLFGDNDAYTLGMADITNGSIFLNGKTVALNKYDFTENPILINKTIEASGTKIGYLMYNQFTRNSDLELNNAIAQLKSNGITELVIDLRYNPGGDGDVTTILSSMITGQFLNDIFYTEVWNTDYQNYFETNQPESLINRFTDKLFDNSALTSLNLNKVYVLTTNGTASASELLINGLNPYIDVVQIGTTTYGKYVGSVTLYDSNDFGKDNANPNHKYALQPIAIKATNSKGVSDYYNGIPPNHTITYETSSGAVYEGENILNMGILGDVNEPFLAKAISLITGSTTKSSNSSKAIGIHFKNVADSKEFTPIGKTMNFEYKSKK